MFDCPIHIHNTSAFELPIRPEKPRECVAGQRTEWGKGSPIYKSITIGNYITGDFCLCPTPRGVKIEGGEDTNLAVHGLKPTMPGGVLGVLPLDALNAGVRAGAPVESRSRGRTRRTKSEPPVCGYYNPSIGQVGVLPPKRGSRTPIFARGCKE